MKCSSICQKTVKRELSKLSRPTERRGITYISDKVTLDPRFLGIQEFTKDRLKLLSSVFDRMGVDVSGDVCVDRVVFGFPSGKTTIEDGNFRVVEVLQTIHR